jgi:formylglycine-generating enzyme required for sulfatase activity
MWRLSPNAASNCVDSESSKSRSEQHATHGTLGLRGGGFFCNAYDCHSEFRRANLPAQRYRFLGFRVALRPSETK